MATYKPGDIVPSSGIYKVTHTRHQPDHEVTVVVNHKFPHCKHCGDQPRFTLIRAANYVDKHVHFVKEYEPVM